MDPQPTLARRGRFRWWHGWLLGLLLGVALWQIQSAFAGPGAPSKASGISVQRFAHIAPLIGNGDPDVPLLVDVRIHPATDGKNLLTALARGTGGEPDYRIEVLAPIPFVVQPPTPRAAPRSTASLLARAFGAPTPVPAAPKPVAYADVREFLAKAAPSLPVRFAWWDDSRLRTTAAIGGPFAVFGLIVPFALQTLVWLGLLAPLPPKPPKPVPAMSEPPPKLKVDVDALVFADGQLNALTEQMAERLAARSDDDAVPAIAPVIASFEPTPAAALVAPPLDPIAPTEPVDPTSFEGGVYYPVHRPKRGEA